MCLDLTKESKTKRPWHNCHWSATQWGPDFWVKTHSDSTPSSLKRRQMALLIRRLSWTPRDSTDPLMAFWCLSTLGSARPDVVSSGDIAWRCRVSFGDKFNCPGRTLSVGNRARVHCWTPWPLVGTYEVSSFNPVVVGDTHTLTLTHSHINRATHT